jgi:hypothetical protein
MDRVTRREGFAFVLGLALSACASAQLGRTKSIPAPLTTVRLSFAAEYPAEITPEQATEVREVLVETLGREGVTVAPDGEMSVPTVTGAIHVFDPGHRALRVLPTLNAGYGNFQSVWRIRDTEGAELGHCQIGGHMKTGLFGGSYDEVIEQVGVRLADCLLQRAGAPPSPSH